MRKPEPRKVTLPKEMQKQAIDDIVKYFEGERNETIGNMEALLFYTFIMEKIGPRIYNQAIMDTQKYMSDKVDDLYSLLFLE